MARSRLRLKCDGTLAETRFRLSAKRTSQFKSTGRRQFSRLLTAEVCASAVVVLGTPCSKVVRRVLATHCIRQFPFTSPPLRHRVPSHFNWTLRHMFPVTAMPVPFAPCAVSVRCSDNSYPQTDSISGHRLREKPTPFVQYIMLKMTIGLMDLFPKCASESQGIRNQFPGDPWIHFCNGYFEVHLL